nr:hypothetical protein [Psychrobacter sp. PraFG1]UNK04602.1 hypothetical protein MN210_10040 [Psychrobacter sp. PraFG1]
MTTLNSNPAASTLSSDHLVNTQNEATGQHAAPLLLDIENLSVTFGKGARFSCR